MIWLEYLQSRLKEYESLTENDIRESLEQAFNEYSGYHQKRRTTTIMYTDSKFITLPEDWKPGFSYICSLEYPLASVLIESNPNNLPIPAIRETTDYQLYNNKALF